MKKTIIILFLLAAIGCNEVRHDCTVVDKYRTFSQYGTPYSYLILRDKKTGTIYEKRVSAGQYNTPIGGSITITRYE